MSRSSTLAPQPVAERRTFLIPFSRPKLVPEAIAFQDPIDEICEQPAPTFLRSIHYLVVALFAALLMTAAITKVDVVVVAPGRLATATPPIVLMPLERGILRELRVRPGDIVAKGQVVATFDPTSDALEKQSRSLQAQLRRIDAEVAGLPFEVGSQPGDEDALQAMLYHQRQAEYAARLQVFDEDIRRLHASLQAASDERDALGHEIEVARSVEEIRSKLLQLHDGSRLNLLEAQAGRLHTERDQQAAANRLQESLHSMESRQAERQAFIDGWHRELLENQFSVRTEVSRVAAALAKAARLKDLIVVKAPDDGVVLDVAPRTSGSVLREAEPLLTIIPRDAPMIADVMIASGDVGDSIPGADVKLKIDAFPYLRHGMLPGRLLAVSEESFTGNGPAETGQGAMHRGRIGVLSTSLSDVPPGARLFPGMTLTAEIKAGTRSVLSYFMDPLTRGLHESVRER
jgi:hemolysin D